MSIRHNQIKSLIDGYTDIVTRYHTKDDLLRKAEQLVPISELLVKLPDINTDTDGEFRESLLPLVVDWFAQEFFSWFDRPECSKCKNNPQMTQLSRKHNGNLSVEYYECPNFIDCHQSYDFPRYNDPEKLLETRTGRCGEWANCFLLILRSLSFDARIVVDVTDHVWCEVWSERRKCWIHVDPGEGVDRPLVYEAGWKKKLIYCIAVSPYEVQDVTWRYVIDLRETCCRRALCSESWLAFYLIRRTEELLSNYSEEFKNKIRDRKFRELASFIRPPGSFVRRVNHEELAQRKTGSLAWRIDREEFSTEITPHNIVTIRRVTSSSSGSGSNSSSPSQGRIYSLKYNCCQDRYTCNDENYLKSKWSSLIYEAKNVDRKFEHDWKIAYIARYESCPAEQDGEITWKFDLKEIEKDWKMIKIAIDCEIYPGTNIDICFVGHFGLSSDEQTLPIAREILHNQVCTITSSDVNSVDSHINKFDIKVRLSGGEAEDKVAWQKPQLFRQSKKTQYDIDQFVVEIY